MFFFSLPTRLNQGKVEDLRMTLSGAAQVGGQVPQPLLSGPPSSLGSLSFAHKAKIKMVEKKGRLTRMPHIPPVINIQLALSAEHTTSREGPSAWRSSGLRNQHQFPFLEVLR